MSKYRVLKPIEYSPTRSLQDRKMYFPPDYWGFDQKTKTPVPPPFKVVPSGCNGEDIPIDASGFIELPDEVAKLFTLGQIAPPDGEADNSSYKVLGDALAAEQAKRGIEDKVSGAGGKDEWKSGSPRTVTTVGTEGTLKVG